MIKFTLQRFYDPFGDKKAIRVKLKRESYTSSLSIKDVEKRIQEYNKKANYYDQVELLSFDKRTKVLKSFDS